MDNDTYTVREWWKINCNQQYIWWWIDEELKMTKIHLLKGIVGRLTTYNDKCEGNE